MEVRLYKVVRTELSFLISGVRAFCLYCKIIRSCLNSLSARWRITPVWKVSRTSLTAILAIGFLNSLVMRHQVTSDWICNVCLKKKKIAKGPPWFLRNCREKKMVFFPSNSEAQSVESGQSQLSKAVPPPSLWAAAGPERVQGKLACRSPCFRLCISAPRYIVLNLETQTAVERILAWEPNQLLLREKNVWRLKIFNPDNI